VEREAESLDARAAPTQQEQPEAQQASPAVAARWSAAAQVWATRPVRAGALVGPVEPEAPLAPAPPASGPEAQSSALARLGAEQVWAAGARPLLPSSA
jgi:hypothetical protein